MLLAKFLLRLRRHRLRLLAAFLGLVFFVYWVHRVAVGPIGNLVSDVHVEPIKARAFSVTTPRVGLVILGHDRPEYFRQSFASVLRARLVESIDVIVSMDSKENFASLQSVIDELGGGATVWDSTGGGALRGRTGRDGITFHYKSVLGRLFDNAYDFGILLESDLIVSEDFIEYMLGASRLLDPSNPASDGLLCVSGWGSMSINSLGPNPSRLLRVDKFPGLGWMIHRSMWTSILSQNWAPLANNYNYDVWLTINNAVEGRESIVPEVARTHHVAKYGTHVNGGEQDWLDWMLLAGPNDRISQDEITRVGSVEEYDKRIQAERILPSKILPMPNSLDTIPYRDSVLIFFDPEEINTVRSLLNFGGKFVIEFAHKGLFSFTLGSPYGGTNITFISDPDRSYSNT